MNKLTLSEKGQNKWLHNIVLFLAPLGILYLTTLIGVISQDGHSFSLKDFMPTQVALGGMILWVLNAALDYLRKLQK